MDFKKVEEEIRKTLNANSVDVACGIPDHILAKHLMDSLIILRRAYRDANDWRGIPSFSIGEKITVQ